MTNSALPEETAVDALGRQLLPETKEFPSPRQYRTSSSADDSDDAVLVQPSFDDHGALRTADSSSPLEKSRERQSRSPVGDKKDENDDELRNPSSPDRQGRHGSCHTRNLSALFGATTISDNMVGDEQIDADMASRKHRRMFSGDVTNPNLAHRRLNSVGTAAPVPRRYHHREGSEGLDILSAAAHATKEEISAVAAQHPRPSQGPASLNIPPSYPPQDRRPYDCSSGLAAHHSMEPPPQRQRGHHVPLPHSHSHPGFVSHYPPGTGGNGSAYHHYAVHSHPTTGFYNHHYGSKGPIHHYPQPHYSQQQPGYFKGNEYDVPVGSRPRDSESIAYVQSKPVASDWESQRRNSPITETTLPSSSHQGVQTFVTAIAVGQGSRVIPTSKKQKDTATNTEVVHPPLPAEVGHHRKLSSFSSLGTILGSSLFASTNGGSDADDTKKKGHHRATSSSVSFLNGLEVDDANFLRNLQASNASAITFRSSPPPAQQGGQSQADQLSSSPSDSPTPEDNDTESQSGVLKLAAGGTSKRIRRKCTAPGCSNRVVQGGLCISHGAKRKTCKHPGCNKNVKKAGLCSTHGPARKRCEHPDCPKVAVQGGRCIAHGAKKKLCSMEGCAKQAILSGMCKKHHDQAQQMGKSASDDGEEFCRPVTAKHKPTHTRGLSIFQEMSADAVSSLLNDQNSSKSSTPAPTAASSSW